MKEFSVNEKIKLSRFLLGVYDGSLSFSTLNKLLRKKDIKVNGVRVSEDKILSSGDAVTVYYDGEKKEIQYKTLYKDDNVLVAVKPKGITSEDFHEMLNTDGSVYFCHRLDRNTDGIMLFGRNEKAYNEILNGFKNRTFEKIYLAKVYGVMDKKEDILEGYLFKDVKNSKVTIYDRKIKGSLPIKTKYRVIDSDGVTSTLEVTLLTGRTHQIRAHLAYAGHFVLGDGKYGSEAVNRSLGIKSLQLTAKKLILHFEKEDFLSYLDGKTFNFECFDDNFND